MNEMTREDAVLLARELGERGSEGFTFVEMYSSIVFLAAIWGIGHLFKLVGVPILVGEIAAGIILGPHVLNFVSNVVCWKMLGEVGLMLLVTEAGLDVDLEMLRVIGLRGMLLALFGSAVPLGLGVLISLYGLGTTLTQAFVLGAAMAPTSMGVALNILRKEKYLNTPLGQLVIAAAILDDIIAIMLLAEIETLQNEKATAFQYAKPLLAGVGLLVGFGFLAVFCVPRIIHGWVFPCLRESLQPDFSLLLVFLFVLLLVPCSHFSGTSYLLGCFISGLSFCTESVVREVWESQVKRHLSWLLRIFFAATIAFEIPVNLYLDGQVIVQGLFLFVCIIGKLATGIFAPGGLNLNNFFIIAFSMSAWGEFAFIVIVYGKEHGILNESQVASATLAILLSMILSPTLLRLIIRREAAMSLKVLAEVRAHTGKDATGEPPLYYFVQCASNGAFGQTDALLRTVTTDFAIVDMRSFHPPSNNLDAKILYEMYLKDKKLTLPVELYRNPTDEQDKVIEGKLQNLHVNVSNALNDKKAFVRVGRWFAGIQGKYDQGDQVNAYKLAKQSMKKLSVDFDHMLNKCSQGVKYNLEGFVNIRPADIVWEKAAKSDNVAPTGVHPVESLQKDCEGQFQFGNTHTATCRYTIASDVGSVGLLEVFSMNGGLRKSTSDSSLQTLSNPGSIRTLVTDQDISMELSG